MDKNKQIILLVLLIVLLFIINYSFIDSALINFLDEREVIIIDRVVDGDTVVSNDKSIRLLGINCPEKGEQYYTEAKDFLEESILNKTITNENYGQDRYYRDLSYLFDGSTNINLEIVRNRFANVYILDNKKYTSDLRKAWEDCIESGKNLCEKSKDKCVDCIMLKEFNWRTQEVIFYNKCSYGCDLTDWSIKDEGRKKYMFKDFILKSYSEVVITNKDFDENYVWTDTGDTLFLRDSENKLVLWKNY